MDLSPRRFADALVLRPTGTIDHITAPAFRAALDPHLTNCTAGGDRVVLDFSEVPYISSAGLRVLILASKQAKAQGGTIAVAALQPLPIEIFAISRFDMVLTAFPTVGEALAELSPAAHAAFNATGGA
jgi:anti-sigma B factor antagonist/stage II sporulation protein AA (anti-sigma F factor antagonist)